MMTRAFIAMELDARLKATLHQQANFLRTLDRQNEITWVSSGNYHLTLSFLGIIDTAILPTLEAQLDREIAGSNALQIETTEICLFPMPEQPRIIAAMVYPDRLLKNLQKCVEVATRSCQLLSPKRRFVPHITLGRVKQAGQPLNMVMNAVPLQCTARVSNVVVYQSLSSRHGSVYIALTEKSLS